MASLDNAFIVFDGNSLTNRGTPPEYPTLLMELPPWASNGATFSNQGSAGQTTGDMLSDVVATIDPLYASNAGKPRILVCWEIGNDLEENTDAMACYNRMVQYCTDRQAVGWKVVLVVDNYRQTTGQANAGTGDSWATYNAKGTQIANLMRANWKDYADVLVDFRDDPEFTDVTNTSFFLDGCHHTVLGKQIIAQRISDRLVQGLSTDFNVLQDAPAVGVAMRNLAFNQIGLNANNTRIIYKIDQNLKSWVPGREINGITGFEPGKGYYIVPSQSMDLSPVLQPPLI